MYHGYMLPFDITRNKFKKIIKRKHMNEQEAIDLILYLILKSVKRTFNKNKHLMLESFYESWLENIYNPCINKHNNTLILKSMNSS